MRRLCAKSLLIVSALLLVDVSLSFVPFAIAQEEPQARAIPLPEYDFLKGHRTTESLCGVTATYVILKDFGIEREYQQVLAKMPPGVYGSLMQQIVDYLGEYTPLQVTPVKCSAWELHRELRRSSERRAIINLVDHWVVVQRAYGDAFEIVDFPRKYFMPVDAIDDLWDGHSIIVGTHSRRSVGRLVGLGLLAISFTGITVTILYARRRKSPYLRDLREN